MGILRAKPDRERIIALSVRLRLLDKALIDLVMECQADMTMKGAGELVTMQRKLRAMRHKAEIEAGIW